MFTNWQKTYRNTQFQMRERLSEAEQYRQARLASRRNDVSLSFRLRRLVAPFRPELRPALPARPALS